jgi:hypothetical protein
MEKKFDSVGFQRKVREELSREYLKDRDSFLKGLKDKYGLTKRKKSARASDKRSHTAHI